MEFAGIQSGRPAVYRLPFLSAAVVTGIDCHNRDAAHRQQLQRLLQGSAGSFRTRDQRPISARQVTQIEKDSLNRTGKICCHFLVPALQQSYLLTQTGFGQPARGTVDSLLLDIKAPDMPFRTSQTGQQKRVMSISAGGIHDCVTRLHKTVYKQMRKRHRPAQQRYFRKGGKSHSGKD